VTGPAQFIFKGEKEMSRKGQRTKGIEEAHPFAGMSQVNPNAAGADIGASEIVVCVAGDETTQIVKGFGNYYYPDALSGHGGLAIHREVVGSVWS
jgi:hypothetical protein